MCRHRRLGSVAVPVVTVRGVTCVEVRQVGGPRPGDPLDEHFLVRGVRDDQGGEGADESGRREEVSAGAGDGPRIAEPRMQPPRPQVFSSAEPKPATSRLGLV